MRSFRRKSAALALVLALAGIGAASPPACAAQEQAVTTADPRVPLDELELLLLPLERHELEVEAAAWLALVKEKVNQLSDAEIAAKYKRIEIAKAREAAEAARTAQEATEDAEEAKAAKAEDVAEVVEAAEAAQDEAQEALEEAAEAEQKTEEDAGVQQVSDEAEAEAADEEPVVADGAQLDPEAIQLAGEGDAEALGDAAEAAEESAEAKTEVREAIFERVAELRDQRIELLERAHLVLDKLEQKGGEVEGTRQYLDAVTQIQIDVTDTTAVWASAIGWLKASNGGMRLLRNLGRFILVVVASWLLAILLSRLVNKALKHSPSVSSLTRAFVTKSLRRVILIAGFIVGLATLEVNVGPLLAIVGGVTFVLAFALQDSLGNVAAGLMIMIFRPFDLGDVVSVVGARGRVDSMNLVSTTIKTPDNQVVLVPNRKIWGDVITNITGSDRRRVDLVFRVGLDADLDTALGVLQHAVCENPAILEEPEPIIRMAEIEESAISLICRPWARTEDWGQVRSDLTRAVREGFREAGIPAPVQVRIQRVES